MLVLAAAAGVAAALALTTPARAYGPSDLPGLGYSVVFIDLGGGCHQWLASGYGSSADFGSDCLPGFQAAVDAFVSATCPCAQPATSSTPPDTTTAASTPPPTTTAPATTSTPAPPGDPAATTTTVGAAPATTAATTTAASTTTTAAPATTTVVVTTTVAASDLDARLSLIEQRLNALDARVTALESGTGVILGELKNEPPFVAA